MNETQSNFEQMVARLQSQMEILSAASQVSADTASKLSVGLKENMAFAIASAQETQARMEKLASAISLTENNLTEKINARLARLRARVPFNGRHPDEIPYNEIRSEILRFAKWGTSNFGLAIWSNIFTTAYAVVADEQHFNAYTYRTRYVKRLRELINRPHYLITSVSLLEICERYGVIRHVYRALMDLSEGGTSNFDFIPLRAVDEEKYPVTLEPRDERAGLPLFPARVYTRSHDISIGRNRRKKPCKAADVAEASVEEWRQRKENVKEDVLPVDAFSPGQLNPADVAQAAILAAEHLPERGEPELFHKAQQNQAVEV